MDQTNSQQMVPPPASPMGAPGIPSGTEAPTGTPELSQEEMKKNLQDMMAKIDAKHGEFVSQKNVADSQVKEQSSLSLSDLFDFFQSKGVDPSNPEDVKAYLDKIKQNDPVAYEKITKILDMLLGDGNAMSSEAPAGEGELPIAPVGGASPEGAPMMDGEQPMTEATVPAGGGGGQA